MNHLWNSFKIAFSMYSKIPMPSSDWNKENMRYVMAFFPLIGLVIGAIVFGWAYLAHWLGLPDSHFFRAAFLFAIPLLISGGIHMDGFLDTSDALSSWQEKERRLEILKDSHAGAFAIICGLVYTVLYIGAASVIEWKSYLALGLSFIQVRALSGFSVVAFSKAKKDGLAATFSGNAKKNTVGFWLLLYGLLSTAAMLWLQPWLGIVCTGGLLMMFWYYWYMAKKNFGGINGDLAGWFLQMGELVEMLLAAAVTLAWGGSIWK